VADFKGGTISSDGGALLLRETDRKMKLLARFAQCFLDGRNPDRIEHSVEQMLVQRVYGLALGYEDLNDHEQLRNDPLLQVLAGKAEPGQEPLAGKSTLNRMELGNGVPDRYKKITFWRDSIDDLLVDVFLEAQTEAPEQIVLDIDTHRFCDPRGARRTLLSRLLRSLLLSAVICVRWGPCAVRTLAAEQSRSLGREPERDRAYREAHSGYVAPSENCATRRFGLLPGRVDGLVRSQPGPLMYSAWRAILYWRKK